MPILPIVIAALAAGGILLIVIGLAGSSPVDPVQARLTQLGSMQAKNLEELELQQPFIERTLRPLAARLSGRISSMASSSFSEKTEKRLALAGNPGDLRVADWLGIKAHRRDRRRDPVLLPVRYRRRPGLPVLHRRPAAAGRRRPVRLHDPGVLARRPRQEAPEGDPADDPGRP